MRVTFKRENVNYSVLSIWPGKFPGSYSVSRDKPSEKYPAISLVDVIKAFAAGDGYVNVSVESEREPRGAAQARPGLPLDAVDFDDPDSIPF
jgi:hypothetical protein